MLSLCHPVVKKGKQNLQPSLKYEFVFYLNEGDNQETVDIILSVFRTEFAWFVHAVYLAFQTNLKHAVNIP